MNRGDWLSFLAGLAVGTNAVCFWAMWLMHKDNQIHKRWLRRRVEAQEDAGEWWKGDGEGGDE